MSHRGRSQLLSQFWSQEIECSRSPEGVARQAPSQSPPLPLLIPSGLSRSQQMLIVQRLFKVPAMPSYDARSGGLVLDRVLGEVGCGWWWATLTARVRTNVDFGGRELPALASVAADWVAKKRTGDAASAAAIDDEAGEGCEATAAPLSSPAVAPPARGLAASLAAARGNLAATGGAVHGFFADRWRLARDPSSYGAALRLRAKLPGRATLNLVAEVDDAEPLCRGLSLGAALAASRPRVRGTLRRDLPLGHAVTISASLRDRTARLGAPEYDTVPRVLAIDVAPRARRDGLRYRLGLMHVTPPAGGYPQGGRNSLDGVDLPPAAGEAYAQAAVAWEGERTLWCAKDPKQPPNRAKQPRGKPYSGFAKQPRLSLGGAVGFVARAPLGRLLAMVGVGRPERPAADGMAEVAEMRDAVATPARGVGAVGQSITGSPSADSPPQAVGHVNSDAEGRHPSSYADAVMGASAGGGEGSMAGDSARHPHLASAPETPLRLGPSDAPSRVVVTVPPRSPDGEAVVQGGFGCAGVTLQFGHFTRPWLDFTSLAVQLELSTPQLGPAVHAANALLPPSRLALASKPLEMLQSLRPAMSASLTQQLVGPVRGRLDVRAGLDLAALGDLIAERSWPPPGGARGLLHAARGSLQEVVLGVDCPLWSAGGAAKVVAWYSPLRREGMAEVRLMDI